jgi:hypothetical protein
MAKSRNAFRVGGGQVMLEATFLGLVEFLPGAFLFFVQSGERRYHSFDPGGGE